MRDGRRVSDFTGSQSSPFLLVDRFRDLLFFIHSIGRRPTGGSPLSPGAGQQSSRRILFRVHHRKKRFRAPDRNTAVEKWSRYEEERTFDELFVKVRQNSSEQAPNGASRSLEAPRKGLGSSAMQRFKLHSRKPL